MGDASRPPLFPLAIRWQWLSFSIPELAVLKFFWYSSWKNKMPASLAREDSNPVLSTMGAHRVLVSRPAFKAGVAYQKWAGWVRFPHAPARFFYWNSWTAKGSKQIVINKIAGLDDINPFEAEDLKEMLVSADNQLALARNSTSKKFIIIRVIAYWFR